MKDAPSPGAAGTVALSPRAIVAAPVLARMRARALASYPEECCGLLVGERDGDAIVVRREIACPNAAAPTERRRRFFIEPGLLVDTLRSLRESGESLVGIYHSHPDAPAVPSATDLTFVELWPETVWLITPVAGGAVGPPRAWWLPLDAGVEASPREIPFEDDSMSTVTTDTTGRGKLPELSSREILRYSRHLIIPEVGKTGQQKLKAARVLMIGAGGLGSPLGLYLGAAGVGTLGIVDFDVVDETNLQRQVLHGTSDVGRSKIDSAAETIHEVNPHVRVEKHPVRLDSENALEILGGYDLVVDGTDNFPTRYLVNDACVLLGKPYVYGSIFRFEGQVSVFAAEGGPCYRCLFREPPPPGLVPSCAEGGVLGVLPGLIGSAQAMEAIKLVVGIGTPLVGRLALFDGLDFRWREVRVRRNPDCPVCGEFPTITELIDYEAFCGIPEARAAEAREARDVPEISATELKARIDRGERVELLDVREPHEWEIANLEAYGARLVPLDQLPDRLRELEFAGDVVVYCKGGGRSARAAAQLRAAGFRGVWNLAGGIVAWSDEVDPDVPKY